MAWLAALVSSRTMDLVCILEKIALLLWWLLAIFEEVFELLGRFSETLVSSREEISPVLACRTLGENYIPGSFIAADVDLSCVEAECGWEPYGLAASILKKFC